MTELKKQLQECVNELRQVRKIRRHTNALRKKLIEEEKDLQSVYKSLKKEYKDIEILENGGLKSRYHNFIGNKIEKLEKEKEEYNRVASRFSQLYKTVEIIKFELEVLSKKEIETDHLKYQIEKLTAERENELLSAGGEAGIAIKKLNDEISQLGWLNNQYSRAYEHGQLVFGYLRKIEDFLKLANSNSYLGVVGYNDFQFLRENTSACQKAFSNFSARINKICLFVAYPLTISSDDFKLSTEELFGHFEKIISGNKKFKAILSNAERVKHQIMKALDEIELHIKSNKKKIKSTERQKKKLILKA